MTPTAALAQAAREAGRRNRYIGYLDSDDCAAILAALPEGSALVTVESLARAHHAATKTNDWDTCLAKDEHLVLAAAIIEEVRRG
jgi:hypothetical protein